MGKESRIQSNYLSRFDPQKERKHGTNVEKEHQKQRRCYSLESGNNDERRLLKLIMEIS